MPKLELKGFDDYGEFLRRMGENADSIIKPAVYEGAKVVAAAFKEQLETIPIDEHWGTPNNMDVGLRKEQKQGLLDGLGIASMKNENGFVNVKIGFDGYSNYINSQYPNGQPNALIARSLAKGTSFSNKIPFAKKAVKGSKKECLEAMQITIDKKINALRKG